MAERRVGTGLAAACLSAALMPLNSTMIAVALPGIADDVGATTGTVTQALVGAYLVTAIVLQSPGGKLGDRIGHGRLLYAGQGCVLAGAAVGFVGSSLWLLALARVLMAIGGAALVPSAVALLRNELPEDRRGRAFGMFGALMTLAAALGPLIGGELVRLFGWPSVFVANVPVIAVCALLAVLSGLGKDRARNAIEARFDFLGSALIGVALTAIVVGLQVSAPAAWVLGVGGVALLVPFWLWERRARDPVIEFDLFRSPAFTAGTLLVALQNFAMYALLFEVPIVLHEVLGLDAEDAGRILVTMMLAVVVAAVVAGRLTDLLGARLVAITGSLLAVAGMALLRVQDLDRASDLTVGLVVLGIGLGRSHTRGAGGRAERGTRGAVGYGRRRHVDDALPRRCRWGSRPRCDARRPGTGGGVDGGGAEIVADHRALLLVFGAALVASAVCAAALPGRVRGSPGEEDAGVVTAHGMAHRPRPIATA